MNRWCCGNQGLQVFIRLTNRVAEKGNRGCIGSNTAPRFRDNCCALFDRIVQFPVTVVAVNSQAKVIAGRKVARQCEPNSVARKGFLNRWSLHTRKRLTHDETQLGIQGE